MEGSMRGLFCASFFFYVNYNVCGENEFQSLYLCKSFSLFLFLSLFSFFVA